MTTRNELTGSQNKREIEIQNYSLNFEPISSKDIEFENILYTVPLGQNFTPEIIFNSSSYTTISDAISIQKEIHLFESEQDATKFLTDIGVENVAAIKYNQIHRTNPFRVEIYLINHPILNLNFEILNFEEKEGYRIEIFKSGSNGLEKIYKDVIKDNNNTIISDTYLKYFHIETDKNV